MLHSSAIREQNQRRYEVSGRDIMQMKQIREIGGTHQEKVTQQIACLGEGLGAAGSHCCSGQLLHSQRLSLHLLPQQRQDELHRAAQGEYHCVLYCASCSQKPPNLVQLFGLEYCLCGQLGISIDTSGRSTRGSNMHAGAPLGLPASSCGVGHVYTAYGHNVVTAWHRLSA